MKNLQQSENKKLQHLLSIKGLDKTVPSAIPSFLVKEPVAMFLTINSTGIISARVV